MESSALPSPSQQARFMELALQEANKCIPAPTAFCVGAVITRRDGQVLAAGYSRELEGNTHAEANAIDKLVTSCNSGGEETEKDNAEITAKELLKGSDMYTTMEPCSVRLSGNIPCVKRILETGIARIFLGTVEPDDFVKCEGVQLLQNAGVEVHTVPGFADRCLEAARRQS